jgi:pilus assembly protein CpaB
MRLTSLRPDVLFDSLAGWPRRLAAAFCLIAAVVSALRPGGSTGQLVPVVVAARPIAAGATLTATDLRIARWPAGDVPSGAVGQLPGAVGGRVAGPLARGEPVSSGVLLAPAVARALALGLVATTVTLTSPDQAAILHTGAVIDLYSGSSDGVMVEGKTVSDGSPAQPLANDVEVLAVLPAAPAQSAVAGNGLSLVIAARPATAARLAAHVSGTFLATLVRPS